MAYDLKDVHVPRIAGTPLKLVAGLLERSYTRWLLEGSILKDMGFPAFDAAHLTESPTALPLHSAGPATDATPVSLEEVAQAAAPINEAPFRFWTVMDYAAAYREGRHTPVQVATRVVEALEQAEGLTPPLRAMLSSDTDEIMALARASTARFEQGAPRGIFDGVPVAVKDEFHQAGYPTTVGTSFLGREPQTEDATVVQRFRDAGAMLIGKANMHEIGIGVTGINPHHGPARNPYDPACFTGGSSSGSAASVAAGLCPVAIGADGGGSIRIPAGLCGAVGLKATFGRISEHGAAPLCWSLAHAGPIASTVQDTALAYALMAGPDPLDPLSLNQPAPRLDSLDNTDLRGIKVGIFKDWFEHAEPDVVRACYDAVNALEERGAIVVPIEISELDLMRIAHGILITSEMSTAMEKSYEEHRKEFGLDVRINLALARRFPAGKYVKGQQVRNRAMAQFEKLLQEVDVIASPTTACTSGPISEDAVAHGESDLGLLTKVMRFAVVGNLTGLPCISVPAGYDQRGMPVGFQLMGRAFEEHTLLRLGRVVEGKGTPRRPEVYFDLLGSEK